MDRHAKTPFFAFINYDEAHHPYAPPSPHRERFLESRASSPWGRKQNVDVEKYLAGNVSYDADDMKDFSELYDGAINYQDLKVGEVLDYLRRRDLLDKTLVIITADHGENLGDHGLLSHFFCLYNSLLHVPIIVRLPGVVPSGATVDVRIENRPLWSLIDRVLSGAAQEQAIPVEDLVCALQDECSSDNTVLSELYKRTFKTEKWSGSPSIKQYDRSIKCIQAGQLKYIQWSDGSEELYDLSVDPTETTNVADARREDLKRLRELLMAKVASFVVRPVSEAPEPSRELREQLRNLGYVD